VAVHLARAVLHERVGVRLVLRLQGRERVLLLRQLRRHLLLLIRPLRGACLQPGLQLAHRSPEKRPEQPRLKHTEGFQTSVGAKTVLFRNDGESQNKLRPLRRACLEPGLQVEHRSPTKRPEQPRVKHKKGFQCRGRDGSCQEGRGI
jgi:hypothetical protein